MAEDVKELEITNIQDNEDNITTFEEDDENTPIDSETTTTSDGEDEDNSDEEDDTIKSSETGDTGSGTNGMFEAVDDAENTNTLNGVKLTQPYNPEDPYCVFDPTYEIPLIAKMFAPQKGSSETQTAADIVASKTDDTAQEKVQGQAFPLVTLNSITLPDNCVADMRISMDSFIPRIHLVIRDYGKKLSSETTTSLNNQLIVTLVCPPSSAYKNIRLKFYITNITKDPIFITIDAVYAPVDNIREILCKQIKYNGKGKINTWEYFYAMAKELKLGFASEKGLNTLADSRYRLACSERYLEHMIKNINYSGSSDTEMLDAWIDLQGYVTLVNLYKILNCELDFTQLCMYSQFGIQSTDANTPDTKTKLVNRLLIHSINTPTGSNMEIDQPEWLSNTASCFNNGTLKTLSSVRPEGYTGSNGMHTEQIRVVENSIDGESTDKYNFQEFKFVGFECNNEVPILYQKEYRSGYINRLESNLLVVRLKKSNFALQRGMLVGIWDSVNDPVLKAKIYSNAGNVLDPKNKNNDEGNNVLPPEQDAQQSSNPSSDIIDGGQEAMNPSISGIYYIHRVYIDFYDGNDDYTQQLVCIRKGSLNKLDNLNTNAKFLTGASLVYNDDEDDTSSNNSSDTTENSNS